jgi:CheY-like chemotaxis protein
MSNRLLSGLRVLVVEDEMMLLLMIEGMLGDMGCESLSAAATVKQALALVEAQTFDVAMLDLNLNGDRAYPIADALAARRVPFLFATGYGTEGVIEGYRDHPVLRKPYRFHDLVSTLERLIHPDRLLPAAA